MNLTKQECIHCKKTKPMNEFYTHKHYKNNHETACKLCVNKMRNKRRRINNNLFYSTI